MKATRARITAFALPFAVATLLGPPAEARVVSYAPVTAKQAIPAVQERTNRRFVLVESDTIGWWGGGGPVGLPNPAWGIRGRLVVHDATGAEEPRVVFPAGGGEASIALVAAQEAANGTLRILAVSDAGRPSDVSAGKGLALYLSPDGGRSWKELVLPEGLGAPMTWNPIWSPFDDFGGPICRGRNPYVRIGNDRAPFVVLLSRKDQSSPAAVAAVTAEGALRPLAQIFGGDAAKEVPAQLVGRSGAGDAFLLTGRAGAWGVVFVTIPQRGIYRVGLGGDCEPVLAAPSLPDAVEGWLTPGGAAYVEVLWYGARPQPPLDAARGIFLVKDNRAALVLAAPPAALGSTEALKTGLFAIPTAGFDGAWVVQRGPGQPTVLSQHTAARGLAEAWRDVTAPEVEALHAGASGRRLLVQVHRPRPQADQRLFKDPALGLWEVGETAPHRYDELFLVEQEEKGFVHLDVEAIAEGAPFVFDGGIPRARGAMPPGAGGDPASGGADVVQEWGVVKASLRQRLVVPAVARAAGAGGAFWKTDLILQNPSREPVSLRARFVPGYGEERTVTVALAPLTIRGVPDALKELFEVESGSGALFLEPEGLSAIQATSRTSTEGPSGSYGLALGAVDVYARASARFPLSFAAALNGAGFRTNAGAVNVGDRPAEVRMRAADGSGWTGRDVVVSVPAGGFGQWNGIASAFGVPPWQAGALSVEPQSGEVVPFVIAIDDTTNDPTAFPADLPASVVRTIPAVVHADGKDGARYRTDLFLYNAADDARSVTLAARRWDGSADEKILTLTLLAREARVIRDVLRAAFSLEGVARLRFQSGSALETTGVRVTSRTYTTRADGGTYGLVVPPLNSFQAAGPGEALEILGPVGGKRFRTNLALVDLTAFPEGAARRVEVEIVDGAGRTLDTFSANVPPAGGLQIDDLFRARGLGDGPPVSVLRIRPAAGLIGAYATTIDQGTNDPAYHAAALAARE